jgi:hypothetical protein
MGEYYCIDIAFEDKTAMHFVIDPSFKRLCSWVKERRVKERRIKERRV